MYQVVNMMEKAVLETVDSVLSTISNVCPCERCKADIVCLTLNQLEPRYVIHRYGEILSRAEFDTPQRQAEIITAVMKAVHKIQLKPHIDKPRGHQP